MSSQYLVALVGDYNPSVPAHQAIPVALDLAAAHHGARVKAVWVSTSQIQCVEDELDSYDGVWCVPASPYKNTVGALDAIRFAREQRLPFLGTCGGFQHALMEYARNVLCMANTDHAELAPSASHPLISALTCSLLDAEEELLLEPESLLHKSYGTARIREQYRCSYGPNPEYENKLFAAEFRVTARDTDGQVRAAELRGHPFFVGTLFQPERRALKGELPPIVREFVGVLATANRSSQTRYRSRA
jgi:CTP synthase (UTP-ammonia lyase)